jgi:hypothetical protein
VVKAKHGEPLSGADYRDTRYSADGSEATDEARMRATVARIESALSRDGGLHHYASDTYYGGGEWLLLTVGFSIVAQTRRRGKTFSAV